MIKRFLSDRRGSYALSMAVAAIPLLLAAGMAIDYSRQTSAQKHLQELADAASLTLARSEETSPVKLRKMAEDMIFSNQSHGRVEQVRIAFLEAKDDWVDVRLAGSIPTTFMGLANIDRLDVSASSLAERAITGNLEVALVLDNTWSMSATDSRGVSRIAALKIAAASLVTELFRKGGDAVKIGLVPFADYVNVGTRYRKASWLDVPDDYSVQPKARTCQTLTTKRVCVKSKPTYACYTVVDGVREKRTCGGGCEKSQVRTVPAYNSCRGGGSPQKYTWYGCVGSRKKKDLRLTDAEPAEKYPGFLGTLQRCLNPILPLTNDKGKLLAAASSMIINIGSYKPGTYIPAGLIWGQNILSPSQPFTEGAAYHEANVRPRKVLVLMTDGENTLRFNGADGMHPNLSTNAATAAGQVKQTNKDTAEICDYIKSNKIEVFTVAFMVTNKDAKALLQNRASTPAHFYDASDAQKLLDAFTGIGNSLQQVRLAR